MASRAPPLVVAGRADGISWPSQRRSWPPEASSGRYGPPNSGTGHQGLGIPWDQPRERSERGR